MLVVGGTDVMYMCIFRNCPVRQKQTHLVNINNEMSIVNKAIVMIDPKV